MMLSQPPRCCLVSLHDDTLSASAAEMSPLFQSTVCLCTSMWMCSKFCNKNYKIYCYCLITVYICFSWDRHCSKNNSVESDSQVEMTLLSQTLCHWVRLHGGYDSADWESELLNQTHGRNDSADWDSAPLSQTPRWLWFCWLRLCVAESDSQVEKTLLSETLRNWVRPPGGHDSAEWDSALLSPTMWWTWLCLVRPWAAESDSKVEMTLQYCAIVTEWTTQAATF